MTTSTRALGSAPTALSRLTQLALAGLIGGLGLDILNGGLGDNVVIQ